MLRGTAVRNDLAFTIFLNDPESSDACKPVIETASSVSRLKLPAGDTVTDPAKALHRQALIGRGQCVVNVT